MDAILDKLAAAVSGSDDLESLVRPLLGLLESITSMESTYLTMIDLQHNVQHIVFARNTKAMNIPEGLSVPWAIRCANAPSTRAARHARWRFCGALRWQ